MASGILRTSLLILNYKLDRSPSTLLLINIVMVRIAVFLSNNEQIFLLLFEIMISQVCKPFGTFSYLFVLLARRSPHEPRIHDQGLLVPGLSENTNSVYSCDRLQTDPVTERAEVVSSIAPGQKYPLDFCNIQVSFQEFKIGRF